jgi:hypothetical protein
VATYFRIDPETDPMTGQLTGVNYRLAPDMDAYMLREDLVKCLRDGEVLTLKVEMSDDPGSAAFVIINGSRVRQVLVSETPEPE